MSGSADVVRRRWPLGGGIALRERVVAAYNQPWRHYHDVRHLAEVLTRIDEIHSQTTGFEVNHEVILLAGYFHDVVYDPAGQGPPSNEERSARCAEAWLSSAGLRPPVVREVARLVRGTAAHAAEPGDVRGAILYDADLAILASSAQRYAEYASDVRREYAAVPRAQFAAGRAQVLRALLDQPSLFATSYALERWERPARANVEQELTGLRGR